MIYAGGDQLMTPREMVKFGVTFLYNGVWDSQQIALLEDLELVIVVTADPLVGEHGDKPWQFERQNLNLVADFIAALPDE